MPKHIALAIAASLVIAGWFLVALAPGPSGGLPASQFTIGLILGTMFGQVSLSAAWCALGPFALVRRLPLSFLWLAAITIAFGYQVSGDSQGFSNLIVFGGVLSLQWIVVQLPIWFGVLRYGLRLRHDHEISEDDGHRGNQFGIREIMILTVLVAVVLGAGRLMLGGIARDDQLGRGHELWIFVFLVTANTLISLPLLGSVLLPHRAIAATCGALVFVGFGTALEASLFAAIRSLGPQDEYPVFVALNCVQTAWALTVLGFLRIGGYRLRASSPARASG